MTCGRVERLSERPRLFHALAKRLPLRAKIPSVDAIEKPRTFQRGINLTPCDERRSVGAFAIVWPAIAGHTNAVM